MSFKQENEKTKYESMGAGNFPARIVHLIDMGKQHKQGYNKGNKTWFPLYYVVDSEGKTVKNEDGFAKTGGDVNDSPVIQDQYRVTFEFPTKLREFKGEMMPRWIKKDYGFVGLEKLAKLVSEGSIESMVSKPCFVTVGQTSGGYDKVVSVSPPIDGVDIADLTNPPVLFNFDEPDKAQWGNIPSWYIDDIKKATNWDGSFLDEPNTSQQSAQSEPANDFSEDTPY